jgi:hypothetical protein
VQPVPANQTPAIELLFCEPTLTARVRDDVGLVGVYASAGATPSFGYTVNDLAGLGQLCFAASSLSPPLAAPGYALLGASLLLDPADPALSATLRSGTVGPGAPPAFASGSPITVPATAAGLSAWSQALILDPVTLTARNTQVLETRFLP